MSTLDAVRLNVKFPTGNVEPLLHEIRHALKRLAAPLKSLPMAPGEEQRIESALGEGEVRAELQALGPTVVQETAYPGVWLVTHRNAENEVVARFIEVTRMPEILMAQREDIERGIEKLESELQE